MESAPSGSGFDNGTKIDFNQSNSKCLLFFTSFHHMNENGYYTEWTEHYISIKPDLVFDIDIKISGRDENQIKDYIHDTFSYWLNSEIKKD